MLNYIQYVFKLNCGNNLRNAILLNVNFSGGSYAVQKNCSVRKNGVDKFSNKKIQEDVVFYTDVAKSGGVSGDGINLVSATSFSTNVKHVSFYILLLVICCLRLAH